jgi:octaprenyl-diphosphate synthase
MAWMFIKYIQPQLDLVEKQIERDFQLKAGHVSQFISLDLGLFDRFLNPALLILAAELFGAGKARQVIPLAGIVQFIYLASYIHRQLGNAVTAFSVLVGDYLYSKFFANLCDCESLDFLTFLAKTICSIHEGGILRQELATGKQERWHLPHCLEIIDKETALLTATSCCLGGKIAGATPEEIDILSDFGLNIGRAWGCLQGKYWNAPIHAYLGQARKNLFLLPARGAREALGSIIEALTVLVPGDFESSSAVLG